LSTPSNHARLAQLPKNAKSFELDGHSLQALNALAGTNPFYVYSTTQINHRIQNLKSKLPEGVDVHYAIKANPMPAIVQRVSDWVDGLDVASLKELQTAIATATPRHHISFAGPGKTSAEMDAAICAGIVTIAESERQLDLLTEASQRLGKAAKVALRVNPDFQLKAAGMKMTGGAQPFGIDAERIETVFQNWPEPLQFVGFHIFSGSQNLKADAIIAAQNASIELALRLAQSAPQEPEWFNIGGGFGIPYFPGEQPLDVEPIANNLQTLIDEVRQSYTSTRIVIELGRYLVGEAGYYVCQVIDKKQSRGQKYLICNGGMHHHLSLSGNFGQVIRKNYPVVIGNRLQDERLEETYIVGPLCTPLDRLADKMQLPANADVGDYVVVFQSGAYGFSASPHQFLSHPPPVEIVI